MRNSRVMADESLSLQEKIDGVEKNLAVIDFSIAIMAKVIDKSRRDYNITGDTTVALPALSSAVAGKTALYKVQSYTLLLLISLYTEEIDRIKSE